MALTCKNGQYNEVIEKLTEMEIQLGNIYLLYGPIDIMVKFDDLTNIEEFIAKWFNPIRNIGADKNSIWKTMTYIVAIEGPKYAESPFAFMFLNVQPRDAELVQKKLIALPQVISADFVFGPCDFIVPVRAKNQIDLQKTIQAVHNSVTGLEEAYTTVVAMLQI
jgi:DNA-binding Lrp family transcriptional regulator